METLHRTSHLKLQEMCDCYLDTDFKKQLKEMAIVTSTDFMEDGYKYLALALLEATTQEAKELFFEKSDDFVTVMIKIEDGETEFFPQSREIVGAVMSIVRHIIHLEEDEGESTLVLGLRNSQLELSVRMKKDKDSESMEIRFPEFQSDTASQEEVMTTEPEVFECSLCGYTASGKFSGDICPECGLTYWKCGKCNFIFSASILPDECPECHEECDFLNITCYTPDCGGPGNIDPRLV